MKTNLKISVSSAFQQRMRFTFKQFQWHFEKLYGYATMSNFEIWYFEFLLLQLSQWKFVSSSQTHLKFIFMRKSWRGLTRWTGRVQLWNTWKHLERVIFIFNINNWIIIIIIVDREGKIIAENIQIILNVFVSNKICEGK